MKTQHLDDDEEYVEEEERYSLTEGLHIIGAISLVLWLLIYGVIKCLMNGWIG